MAALRSSRWATFLDAQQSHKLPMFTLGWNADYPDPHNFAFPFLHSQGNYPVVQRWKSPDADLLVERGIKETSLPRRKEIYRKLQRLAYDEVPHIVIVDTVRYRAARSWVKGFVANPIFPDSPHGSWFYTLSKQ